jgi:putative phage-type endonuclease
MSAVLATIDPAAYDRRRYLGGSDIAAVLGISPWTTPLQCWERKTAPHPPADVDSKAKRRGRRWEGVVAEMLTEELRGKGHAVEIVASNRRYTDPDMPYLAAEIDFEVRLDGADEITNVELKTVHPFKAGEWGEAGTDEAPLWYVAQVMYGLGVTRRRHGMVAALFGADDLKSYPVERDDVTIAAMRARCEVFWQLVELGIRPDPTTLADLDRLYRGDEAVPPVEADGALAQQVMQLRALKAQGKAVEAEIERVEFEIKHAMGDAFELQIPGERKPAITWKPRKWSRFDTSAFKTAHPDLHLQFTSRGESRVFLTK